MPKPRELRLKLFTSEFAPNGESEEAMKKALICLSVIGALLIARSVYVTWPTTYQDGDMKFVEYHHGDRKGTTCSYFSHDTWNELPLICLKTGNMQDLFKYRK
jgi:hypothetical protein